MAGMQKIRDNLGGPFVKIGVWMIVISFALFFGWGTVFSTSDVNSVATVNGKKIDLYDLDLEMRKVQSNLIERFDDPKFTLEEEVLKSLAIRSLIGDAVVVDYLDSNKVMVSDLTAYRLLSKNEMFLQDGQFSRQRVESYARQNGILPSKYLSNIKKDIALSLWNIGIRNSFFVTNSEIERNIRLANQTRDITFLRLNSSFLEKDLKLSEEDVLSFYNENLFLFQTEEKAKVRYLSISLEDIKSNVLVGEEEIKREYETYIENFDSSVRRSASHLMIKITDEVDKKEAIALAENLKQQIQLGEEFETLVDKYSEDEGTKNSEGDLGISDGTAFPPKFESALLDLKIGQVSAPVALDNSVHLLKLKDIKNPRPELLGSMKESLREDLIEELAYEDFSNILEVAADLTFSLENLDDLSDEMKLEIKETNFFSKNNPDDFFNEGDLLERIFSESNIQGGQLSELIELSEELAVIFEVVDFQNKKTNDFEVVKNRAKTELREKLLEEKITSLQSEILALLQDGNTLYDISIKKGIKAETYKAITRGSSLFPKMALQEIFNVPRPGKFPSYSSAPLTGSDRMIFMVDTIHESPGEVLLEEVESYVDVLLNERSGSELAQLQLEMQDVASVIIKRVN